MKKIALVTNIPTPYRMPLFKRLSKIEEMKFRIFFCNVSEPNRHWTFTKTFEFDYKFVPGIEILRRSNSPLYLNPYLFLMLYKFRPDIIISTGMSFPTLVGLIYSKFFRIPILIWWGGTKITENNINILKYLFRKYFFKFIDGFLAYGQLAKKYLLSLGCLDKDIYVIGNLTFDVDEYNRKINTLRKNKRDENNIIKILSVGQLIPRKNFIFLIKVFEKLVKKYEEISLIIVGSGPQELIIKKYCEERNLMKKIILTGHISPEKLIEYYADADIFVHLTISDQWSQVVNEAMASGLPVIISKNDAVCEDLLSHGENGYIINPYVDDELLHYLSILINNPDLRSVIGKKAYETVTNYDIKFTIKMLLTAISDKLKNEK